MRSVLKGISIAWIAIIALGLAVPASGAAATFAASGTSASVSTNTSVSVNVTASPVVATVLIRSLNVSIMVTVQKLTSLNISKNSTAWALVGKASAALQAAVKANATGNYTAAVKYAFTGLQYVRQALGQLAKAYAASAGNVTVTRLVTMFKAQVSALNRTAYMLMGAVSKAVARGIINASLAASLKANVSMDAKALANLSRYLSMVGNGSAKLNVTYVKEVLTSVSRSLAGVRKELNACAARRIQDRVMMIVREKIRKLEREIAMIEAKAEAAEAANLTQVAKELKAIAANLTAKLRQIEEGINVTVSSRMGGVEKLVALVSRIPMITIVKEQVGCCSKYAVNISSVMANLARIKAAFDNVTKAYKELMEVQNQMPPEMRDMARDLSHSMQAVKHWYGELEAAVAAGSAKGVEKSAEGLVKAAMELNRTLTKMLAYASGPNTATTTTSRMRGGGSGSRGSSSSSVPQDVVSRVKQMVKAVDSLIRLAGAEKSVLTRRVSVVSAGVVRAAARMLAHVENHLAKLMRFGRTTGVLSKEQVAALKSVEANITAAVRYLLQGNVSAASKTIESSVSVLKSIYTHVKGRYGVAVAVRVEIEVMISILVNVHSMISMGASA